MFFAYLVFFLFSVVNKIFRMYFCFFLSCSIDTKLFHLKKLLKIMSAHKVIISLTTTPFILHQ